MTPADFLLLLNLRRQAAVHGWRLDRVARAKRERVFHLQRGGDEWSELAALRTGWWFDADDHAPCRLTVRTEPAGYLTVEPTSVAQAVTVIRAWFGWDDDVDAVWPTARAYATVGGVR